MFGTAVTNFFSKLPDLHLATLGIHSFRYVHLLLLDVVLMIAFEVATVQVQEQIFHSEVQKKAK